MRVTESPILVMAPITPNQTVFVLTTRSRFVEDPFPESLLAHASFNHGRVARAQSVLKNTSNSSSGKVKFKKTSRPHK